MIFSNGVIKRALENVYFIWGSGKTTAANALAERHGFFVYHTDESRSRHFHNADPNDQPAMCRDVPDFWALEPEDALAWEGAVVKEMTPMIVAELIGLAAQHKGVICEGDIDIDQIAPVAANAVTISNHGAEYDFFSRPEQAHMLEEIKSRTDIDESEKQRRIENAYRILRCAETDRFAIPRETRLYGVKQIIRDSSSSVETVVNMIEQHWGLRSENEMPCSRI